MRTTIALLTFPALLLTAGCAVSTDEAESAAPADAFEETVQGGDTEDGASDTETATEGTEEPQERTYAVGEQITVELTMYSTEDGGRHSPFFSGYRPTIEFDHLGRSSTCSVQLPVDLEQFDPGGTHLVGLECDAEIVVHPDEVGFALIEGGKENGEGVVLLTEA